MADIDDVLAANRAAVTDLVAAAEKSAATWTTPPAPGKWSPSQVVEHVARMPGRPRRLRRASAWKGRSPGSTRNVVDGSPAANTS